MWSSSLHVLDHPQQNFIGLNTIPIGLDDYELHFFRDFHFGSVPIKTCTEVMLWIRSIREIDIGKIKTFKPATAFGCSPLDAAVTKYPFVTRKKKQDDQSFG